MTSYCVVSHSRRVHSFFLSPRVPCRPKWYELWIAENPAYYSDLVGMAQTDVFKRDLLGDLELEEPLHLVSTREDIEPRKAKRTRRTRKEGLKRRSVKKKPMEDVSGPSDAIEMNMR